jgi:hypothetical protein
MQKIIDPRHRAGHVTSKESISGRRSTRTMYVSRIRDNFSGSWGPTDLALPKFNSCNIEASAKQTKLTVPSSPEICSVSPFSLARYTNKCFLCLNPSLDLGFYALEFRFQHIFNAQFLHFKNRQTLIQGIPSNANIVREHSEP